MKTIFCKLIIITFLNVTYGQNVKYYFQSNLGVVENFLKSGISTGNCLDEAILVIEEVTKIKCYTQEEDYTKDTKIPNIYNLRDWKKWYKQNKNNLKWNNEVGKIEVFGEKYLIKNPKKEFKIFLEIIKKNTFGKDRNLDDLDFAIQKMIRITNIKFVPIFNNNCSCSLPSKGNIFEWQKWYDVNNESLFWDEKSQSVKVKTE